MAVAFRASALLGDDGAGLTSSISGTLPSSARIGDVALLAVVQATGVNTFTDPSGWTRLTGPDRLNTNISTALWAKKVASGDPGSTVTVNASGGSRFVGVVSVFSGAAGIGDIVIGEPQATATASTSVVSATVPTTVANTAIVSFWAVRSNTVTPPSVTVPGSHTADGQSNTANAAAPNFAIRASHRTSLAATPGSYGGATATISQSSTALVYTVALPPAVADTAPTANAGPDQTVEPWTQVTLSGTASDVDGTIVEDGWSQTGGSPTVTLSGTGATVTFEAPPGLANTTLTFTYSATDNAGNTSTDTMTVTVLQATEKAAVGGVLVPVRFVEVAGDPVDPEEPAPPEEFPAPITMHEWSMWARTDDYAISEPLPIISASFVKRHMGVSTAVCRTPYSAARWAALQPASGVAIYRDGRQEFTGRLVSHEKEWDADSGRATITVEAQGDERGLAGRLVFPDPLRAADDQTVNDYWTSSGVAASTAMVELISDQAGPTCRAERRIPGLVLGSDPGVGVVRSWSVLFEPNVLEQLAVMSVASGANLGLRVTSEGGSLEFSIYEPRDVSDRIVFSPDMNNLVGFTYKAAAPDVTDAVSAGQGELHARTRRHSTTADPLALAWAEQRWVYVDRRDTADSAELVQSADDAVTGGAPLVSLAVTLTDSQAATYGRDWGLGDVVTVYVGLPGEAKTPVVDVVREILFEVDENGVESIRPAIGSYDAKAILPTPTQRQLAAVGGALRGLIARQ